MSIVAIRPSHGDPADVFQVGAPTVGASAPQGADIANGEASVSTLTGAFSYAYPLVAPPGRAGMAPSIALSYNSQAPIYGGIAAGWSLSGIHVISKDTSNGRLGPTRYQSSLAGNRPLVQVNESLAGGATYRARNDASWTRYQLLGDNPTQGKWRAFTTDGKVWYYGETGHGDCAPFTVDYAPLTRVVDKFGNEISYSYKANPAAPSDCDIDFVTWGQNTSAGLPFHFATMKFNFGEAASCAPNVFVGSQMSWRTGSLVSKGTRKLNSISIAAHAPGTASPGVIPGAPDHLRTIILGYDSSEESCSATHAPYRRLSSIRETASGSDSPQVALPVVTFSYGNANFGSLALTWPSTPPTTPSPPWIQWHPAPTTSHFNLGWGYRYPASSSKQPTVEEMLIDIDGDSLPDRVTNVPRLGGGGVSYCQAWWQRNNGTGQWQAPELLMQLPTLKWASAPGTYSGGAYANQNGTNEGCSLNYQQTSFRNASESTSTNILCADGSSCPTSGYCTAGKFDCTPTQPAGPTILSYRWIDLDGDELVDFVASPMRGGRGQYNFYKGNLAPTTESPFVFGDFDHLPGQPAGYADCPNPNYTAIGTANIGGSGTGAYSTCGGKATWFFYKNYGNGQFGESSGGATPWPYPTRVLHQPIPLESDYGESSIISYPLGSYMGTVDLDGDGFSDGGRAFGGSWTSWSLWRNDGTGALLPQSPSTAYSWFTGTSFAFFKSTFTTLNSSSLEGLFDIHGDGLADHWSNTNFVFNNGVSFAGGGVNTNVTPESAASNFCNGSPCLINSNPAHQFRRDTSRTIDMDLDGRVDVLKNSGAAWGSNIHLGGQFGNTLSQASWGWGPALDHVIQSNNAIGPYMGAPSGTEYTWELRSDMVDLDGDGIAEGVAFGSSADNWVTSTYRVSKTLPTDEPPRLLTRINNGHGAETTIAYASMTNPTTVTQHPESGKRMPHTQWVVRFMKTLDSLSSPATDSTTIYRYEDPEFIADDEGRYGFRGFDKATTQTESGSVREDTYSFSPDWSGRLSKTVVKPDVTSGLVHTVDTTTWEERTLFCDAQGQNCALKTYHPTERKHYVCASNQTEATCAVPNNPAVGAGYSQTTSTLSSLTTSGPQTNSIPLMWQETSSSMQKGAAIANGDRRTDTQYYLYSDSSNYRLVVSSETKLHRASGVFAVYAKTETDWGNASIGDTSFRVPWVTAVYIDNNLSLKTSRDFDLATGNLKRIWKPAQWALNSNRSTNLLRTTFSYDNRQLFPVNEVNELGHVRDYTYEYGTGTKLATYGPNRPGCYPSSCPAGTALVEEHRIRVDGLGRMLKRFEVFGQANTYVVREVERNTYVDGPAASVTHEAAIEFVDATQTMRYSQDKVELDGLGHPIRTTLFAQGAAAADQVTSYKYNNARQLIEVLVPDPRQNSSAQVSHRYYYDTVGRPIATRRPGASNAPDSGVDISYNGLIHTTTDFVGADGGQASSTRTLKDIFGRVTQIDEQRGPTEWATTMWNYGPDDNVISIVDADNVSTSMIHDFAGRRTRITRGTRIWNYGYDANGNMTSESTPCTGATCSAAHITTTAFDALDRPTSKAIAPRTLSSQDLALFGAGSETFTWDTAANGIGRLHQWKSFAPAGGTPVSNTSFSYNVQGQEENVQQTHSYPNTYVNLSRSFARQYDVSGNVRSTWFNDVVGSSSCQSGSAAFYQYDNRALLQQVQIQRCVYSPTTPYSYVANTRNVAGVVTKRNSSPGNGVITYAESLWTYDHLGRVTSQIVNKGTPLSQVAQQNLAYFGNDNPRSMNHWLGTSNQKQFTFTYDLRHQLTNVGEVSNAFTAIYNYGLSGRFMTAQETSASLPNGDVTPRNVTYVYSSSDPERVTALRKNPGSKNLATFVYDDGGNQLNRTYPDTKESWDYVYDGKNQLRRATKKLNGSLQGSEEYWYDGANQRYLTVKRNAAGAKTGAIWYIRDTEAHYDANGLVTRAFGHVTMGTPVARTDRSGDGPSNIEYQFHGLAGNTLAAVDQSSGTVNSSFIYAPFGEVIEATNAGGVTNGLTVHRRRLNDKTTDEISGLAYYGARYYDRTLIGWTQSDPIYRFVPELGKKGSPRRANLYQFSLNNPLRYIDPDGRDPKNAKINVGDVTKQMDANFNILAKNWHDEQFTAFKNAAYEAHKLVSCLFNLSCSRSGGMKAFVTDNSGDQDKTNNPDIRDLKPSQMSDYGALLMNILVKSASLREKFTTLLNASQISNLVFAESGDSYSTTFADNGEPVTYWNPNRNDAIWIGGHWGYGGSPGGPSMYGHQDPGAVLAHELFHMHGRVVGTHSNNSDLEETRAWKFENTYRSEAGLPSRDCYFRCAASHVKYNP